MKSQALQQMVRVGPVLQGHLILMHWGLHGTLACRCALTSSASFRILCVQDAPVESASGYIQQLQQAFVEGDASGDASSTETRRMQVQCFCPHMHVISPVTCTSCHCFCPGPTLDIWSSLLSIVCHICCSWWSSCAAPAGCRQPAPRQPPQSCASSRCMRCSMRKAVPPQRFLAFV